MAVVAEQSVRLRAPRGDREIVDGVTGLPTAWISARSVLKPATLPPGYRLTNLIPAVNLARSQAPGPAGCTQFYQRHHTADVVEIIQSAGRLPASVRAEGPWTRIWVRGRWGRAARNLIVWREDGMNDVIAVGGLAGAPEPLSTWQLIAIADSAPA